MVNDNFFDRMLEYFKENSLVDFKRNLYKYPEIEKLVNMKLKDMVGTKYENYTHLLVPAIRDKFSNNTLLQVMEYTEQSPDFNRKKEFEILYSYNDKEEPIGWFCYSKNAISVSNIKMFSFGTNDITFMRDVKERFLDLLKNYKSISWDSTVDNPFAKHYIKAIIDYNGYCYQDDDGSVVYYINKDNPNNDFSNLENIFDNELLKKAGYYKYSKELEK